MTEDRNKLRAACEHAMEFIDSCADGVALFFINGKLVSAKKTSKTYRDRLKRYKNELIGVYDGAADARNVLEDIAEFFKGEKK